MRYRLRQVQIVHRHGDRTPLWNVFAGHKMEEQREAKRWLTKLPSDAVLSDLCGKYAWVSQTPQIVPNRLPSSEFGRLTSIGMEQMIERGVQLVCGDLSLRILRKALHRDRILTRKMLKAHSFLNLILKM